MCRAKCSQARRRREACFVPRRARRSALRSALRVELAPQEAADLAANQRIADAANACVGGVVAARARGAVRDAEEIVLWQTEDEDLHAAGRARVAFVESRDLDLD